MSQAFRGESFQNPMGGVVRYADMTEGTEILPVQLHAQDGAMARGLFYRLRGTAPRVGVHTMHPRADPSNSYYISPLVAAGFAVLARSSRWPNNDVETVHETLMLDFAAGVKFLRDVGCEKIILLGSSGGAALSAMYQAQALARAGERLTVTPAGDELDLNAFDLPPADALAFIAPHPGQGAVLQHMIDPAVVDEDDPLATDPELDLYDPRNGFVTPPQSSKYSPEFLARFRAGQIARVRRIDVKARSLLDRQREASQALKSLGDEATLNQVRATHLDHHMIIHRTTADPAFVDLSLDPDDRRVFSLRSARPDLENYGGNGVARYITPRGWLSTWSGQSTNADLFKNLAKVNQPLVWVHYAGDAITRLSQVREIFTASPAADKTLHVVKSSDHYGFRILTDGSKGERTWEGPQTVARWIQERFG